MFFTRVGLLKRREHSIWLACSLAHPHSCLDPQGHSMLGTVPFTLGRPEGGQLLPAKACVHPIYRPHADLA